MASKMTPEAALGRILGIARGVVSPEYVKKEKMANGGKAKAKKKAKGAKRGGKMKANGMAKGGMRGGRRMPMMKNGGKAMKSKGYKKGGKMKSKGMARGGKAKR